MNCRQKLDGAVGGHSTAGLETSLLLRTPRKSRETNLRTKENLGKNAYGHTKPGYMLPGTHVFN